MEEEISQAVQIAKLQVELASERAKREELEAVNTFLRQEIDRVINIMEEAKK